MILHSHLLTFTFSILITSSDTQNYLPSDDPNITNLMVSQYDCAKQHNLRQFDLFNVKQCTEAPSDITHASVKARVYVRAKAKRIKAFKCVAYAKKERKICFQGSVKYHRVDRAVWNHNTLPHLVTLDPSECKNIIRHLNGTNNKILNKYHINTKIDYTINHVFRSMTVQQLNTLHTICELARNQLLTILAMSVRNPQLAGFLQTGNRSNFLYVEGSTAWLYDCPHFLSPLYKAD